jgi:hypothetical protein
MLRNANTNKQQAIVFILVQGLAAEQDGLVEEQDGYETPHAIAFVVKLMLLAAVLVAPSAFVHTRFPTVLIVRITDLLDCLGWMSHWSP